ncbi:hypothetical protein KO481_32450 [Nocardia sp. NEAU-G5]|uniref:AAA+ ATPase domain-containing protein n=1 Tax=Nocardia albiluteola TaxID=2842303 RepID=A0ABS6B7B6_9NOCA|nr:hypothetical protein [Nocardia albiluteola]MBU3066215.1 hypothetical protein [Nocardia albiluteola]
MPTEALSSQGPAPELDQLIANLRTGPGTDPQVAQQVVAAAQAWQRPARIQVTGRAGAGKTTLLHALALMSAEETAPVDAPNTPDPVLDADLVVYVLASTLQAGDRAVLSGLPRDRTLIVLNKADAVGSRWADAVAAVDQCAYEMGMATLPVVAELAVRTRAGTPAEQDLTTLRRHAGTADPSFTLTTELFTGTDFGPDVADREAVVGRWGLFGVSTAMAALHRDPDLGPQPVRQILHAVSGIDPVHALLHRRYEQVGARRGGEFLDELARLGARAGGVGAGRARDLIEDYLAGDEALWIGLRAGLACPEVIHLAAGYPSPYPADADDAVARAQRWRAVVSSDMPAAARRAALRVHNGYVRLFERMSSAGL